MYRTVLSDSLHAYNSYAVQVKPCVLQRCAVLLGLAACLGCALLARRAEAAGSGRAFPIDSENYVTEQFTRINPSLVSEN